MSYAPAMLLAARSYLISKGVPADGLGIVGDTAHGNEGYHCGWDRLRRSYGTGDYSYGESPRDRVKSDAAMALDFGGVPTAELIKFSTWLAAQCAAGAPDTQDIREVIYTPDGRTVRRWDRLGRRSSGDSSHLFHTHISYFRDSEGRDKTALFKRYYEYEGAPDVDIVQDYRLKILFENWDPTREQWIAAGGSAAVWDAANARGGARNGIKQALNALSVQVTELSKKVAAPAPATATVDASQVAAALAGNSAFVSAIAKAVADEQYRRMQS